MKNRRLNFNSIQQVEDLCKKMMADTYFPSGTKFPVCLKSLGWKFKWSNSKRAFGQCTGNVAKQNFIILSRELCGLNLNNRLKVEDTILHEIAHAIEFVNYGKLSHSSNWKCIHHSIGGTAERCYSTKEVNVPKGKYTLHCDTCGKDVQRYKRPREIPTCGTCDRKFNPKYRLKLIQNY